MHDAASTDAPPALEVARLEDIAEHAIALLARAVDEIGVVVEQRDPLAFSAARLLHDQKLADLETSSGRLWPLVHLSANEHGRAYLRAHKERLAAEAAGVVVRHVVAAQKAANLGVLHACQKDLFPEVPLKAALVLVLDGAQIDALRLTEGGILCARLWRER